jgi:hypothetical protein
MSQRLGRLQLSADGPDGLPPGDALLVEHPTDDTARPPTSASTSLGREVCMRLLLVGLALAVLPTASTQTGCGKSGSTEPLCAQVGQSCMTKGCCPHSDGSVSFTRTFEYPNGVQTVTSCTCN